MGVIQRSGWELEKKDEGIWDVLRWRVKGEGWEKVLLCGWGGQACPKLVQIDKKSRKHQWSSKHMKHCLLDDMYNNEWQALLRGVHSQGENNDSINVCHCQCCCCWFVFWQLNPPPHCSTPPPNTTTTTTPNASSSVACSARQCETQLGAC